MNKLIIWEIYETRISRFDTYLGGGGGGPKTKKKIPPKKKRE